MLSTANDDLIVSSAVDALSHAIESYRVPHHAHTLTETQALKAIQLILKNLTPALKYRDPLAMENLSIAATAAGMSFGNASLGACHAIAHSLGGFFDTPTAWSTRFCCQRSCATTARPAWKKWPTLARSPWANA